MRIEAREKTVSSKVLPAMVGMVVFTVPRFNFLPVAGALSKIHHMKKVVKSPRSSTARVEKIEAPTVMFPPAISLPERQAGMSEADHLKRMKAIEKRRGVKITVPIKVGLFTWGCLNEAAVMHGITPQEALQELVENTDTINEWVNKGALIGAE